MTSAFPTKQFYSVSEIASMGFGSAETVRREIKSKRLPAHRIRNHFAVSRAGLEKYLQDSQVDDGYDHLLRALPAAWELLTDAQKQWLKNAIAELDERDQRRIDLLDMEADTSVG